MSKGDKYLVPNHIAFIPDGNRRWAKKNGFSITKGHQRGYENLKNIIKISINEYGINNISAFIFSNENWKRDPAEVNQLMKMIPRILLREIDDLHKLGVRVKVIGSRLRINDSLIKAISRAEERTKDNTKCNFFLCLDYGGRQEIIEAVKKIIKSGLSYEKINEETLSENLYSPNIPPLDLIIRTSGEHRVSNFMLWEMAYSEFYFTEEYWPDFNELSLKSAISWFSNGVRRFGK